jgi:RimJ/RimL family protein N-acetyltransferase
MTTTYAIRVDGHLDDHWADWLGELDLSRDDDGTTVTVSVADQAQLHGVLAGLRDIGAVLTGLRTTGAPCRPVLDRPLHTARLTLRPATAGDADPAWRYRRPGSAGESLTGYRASFAKPARLAATVVVALGHDRAARVVGDVVLRRDGAPRGTAELGWSFDPAFHGHAAEAVRALLRHCFQDLGLRRITATCDLGDDASRRLAEQVGLRRERRTVHYAIRDGEWTPTAPVPR